MMKFKSIFFGKRTDFQFFGTGNNYRSEKKMLTIDKKEADSAFRKCKSELLNPYMKSKGFLLYKSNAYVRLSPNGLLEFVDIQKESHGMKYFTVNLYIIPVYAPEEYGLPIGYGDYFTRFINGKEFWWDFKDYETAQKSFTNVRDAIEKFDFSFFNYNIDDKNYIKCIRSDEFIGYPAIEWTVHYHLKNNDIPAARSFLKEYYSDIDKHAGNEITKNHYLSLLQNMSELLDNITDIDAYLKQIEEDNMEKFKLPKALTANHGGISHD